MTAMSQVITQTRAARQQRLVELLPANGWDVAKAALAAGYSAKYIRAGSLKRQIEKNTGLCRQIASLRQQEQATRGDQIDELTRSWREIASDPKVATRDRLKAGELLGKTFGIFSETRVIESSTRQSELDLASREEARRLARLRFDTSQGLLISACDTHNVTQQHDIVTAQSDSETDTSSKQPENSTQTQATQVAEPVIQSACEAPAAQTTPCPPSPGGGPSLSSPPTKNPAGAKGTVSVDNPVTDSKNLGAGTNGSDGVENEVGAGNDSMGSNSSVGEDGYVVGWQEMEELTEGNSEEEGD